jgi:hypothetical protein
MTKGCVNIWDKFQYLVRILKTYSDWDNVIDKVTMIQVVGKEILFLIQ